MLSQVVVLAIDFLDKAIGSVNKPVKLIADDELAELVEASPNLAATVRETCYGWFAIAVWNR